MGSSSYLLAVFGAAAFRFLLGVDAGVDYDTTAFTNRTDAQGDLVPRDPWALRVRPDVLFAVYNSRQYFYVQGDGTFVQPFSDTYEASGELITAARLRLGHGFALHPGVFVRAASSNELLRGSSAAGGGIPIAGLFYSVSGGGWIEADIPVARRLRLLARAQAEAWVLDLIPDELSGLMPLVSIEGSLAALIALTHVDGLAVEARVIEGIYPPRWNEDDPQAIDGPEEHQLSVTGRLVYRRFWRPHIMTDIGLGAVALRERDEEWVPNMTASAVFMMVGRPRWLVVNISYERRFEYLTLTSPGAMQDVAEAMVGFGPFSGFSFEVAALWTRTELEVFSSVNDARTTRPFHTIGARLDVRYLYEVSGFGVGPFFEAYVFTPFAEEAPYDMEYEFLPAGYDSTWEVLLFLGLRVQWGVQTGRARRRMPSGGALGSSRSRSARRLAMQRMTREERAVPTFAYGAQHMGATEADEDELFTEMDPLERMRGEYEDELLDGEELEGEDEEEAAPYTEPEPEPEPEPTPEETPPEGGAGEGGTEAAPAPPEAPPAPAP